MFALRPKLSDLSLVSEKQKYNEIFQTSQELSKQLVIKILMERPFLTEPQKIDYNERPCPYLWRKKWWILTGMFSLYASNQKSGWKYFRDPIK